MENQTPRPPDHQNPDHQNPDHQNPDHQIPEHQIHDITIIGAGLVGLTAALALGKSGFDIAVIAPKAKISDARTSALLADSVDFLNEINLWEALEETAYPLKTMRIIDGTKRLFRAPQTDFNAHEINLEAFGYNIENQTLSAAINKQLGNLENVTRYNASLNALSFSDDDEPVAHLKGGRQIKSRILIGADGRNSSLRNLLEIGENTWQYPQIAMVGNFTHTLPHYDTSTEFHTPTGPFTLVPLGQNRSSLVCVVDEAQANSLNALSKTALNLELENRMESILGKVELQSELKQFPLSGMTANKFGLKSVMLCGEAAHNFPPIGAQGLNLGFRDIKTLREILTNQPLDQLQDPGQEYHRQRSMDVTIRTASVDLLNRSLLSDFLPVQMGRSFGLYTLSKFAPLRRFMMRQGIAPTTKNTNPIASNLDDRSEPA